MHLDIGGKAGGKGSLGRPKCRLVDNIKTDPREIGWGGMDWISGGLCEQDNAPSGSVISLGDLE
jgi:hypothetical protein